MVKRSLKVSEQYLERVKNIFIGFKITQQIFADRLQISRSTVSNFFRGKSVKQDLFLNICESLHLDWQEITGLKTNQEDNDHITNVDANKIESLVTKLRHQVQPDIKNRCGTMRIFDMTQPIGLGEIYTQVNILEKIPARIRKDIAELLRSLTKNDSPDRFNFGKVKEEQIESRVLTL